MELDAERHRSALHHPFVRAIGLALLCGVLSAVGYYGATAAFGDTTSSRGGAATKQFFTSLSVSYAAHQLTDNAGTDANRVVATDPFAAVDGIQYTTKNNWQPAQSATRYLDFTYRSPLPAGRPVTDARFVFGMAPGALNQAGEIGCYSLEITRVSTGALLARYPATPLADLACVTGTTIVVTTTALPAVTTTDDLNDLRVRVFGKENKGHVFRIDQAVIEATSDGPLTLYPRTVEDRSGGGGVTVVPTWPLDAVDGVVFTSKNWAKTYATDRYLLFGFPTIVPPTAKIVQAKVAHTYESQNKGDTVCYWFEVFSGATLVGTHGSSTMPVSCNTSKQGYITDTINLPELATPALLQGLAVKLYAYSSGAKPTFTDALVVTVLYDLPTP